MSDDQEKKIVVDDDWKERVRKEREELRKKDKSGGGDAEQPAATETPDAAPDRASDQGSAPQPPPASMEGLISMLATQAMVSMGVMPGAGGEAKVDREFAKHFIDLLGILEEKTKGNLTGEESTMLTQVLHDLRMGFVQLPN